MHYERWRQHGEVGAPHNFGAPILMKNGYLQVWAPGHPLAGKQGYVLEHRKVIFDAGLDATGLVVHHKNHDRTDNRLENLELMTAGDHTRHHAAERRRSRGL